MQPSLKDWLLRKPQGPAPKKRMPKVTPKRAKANREYSVRRKVFLLAHPQCMAWEAIRHYAWQNLYNITMPAVRPLATEIHHMKKPKSKYLNDESTWLAVSRWGHEFIEQNKSIARKLGLLA